MAEYREKLAQMWTNEAPTVAALLDVVADFCDDLGSRPELYTDIYDTAGKIFACIGTLQEKQLGSWNENTETTHEVGTGNAILDAIGVAAVRIIQLEAQLAIRDAEIERLRRQLADIKQFAADYPRSAWTIGCVEHPDGWEYPCACEECLDPRHDL